MTFSSYPQWQLDCLACLLKLICQFAVDPSDLDLAYHGISIAVISRNCQDGMGFGVRQAPCSVLLGSQGGGCRLPGPRGPLGPRLPLHRADRRRTVWSLPSSGDEHDPDVDHNQCITQEAVRHAGACWVRISP